MVILLKKGTNDFFQKTDDNNNLIGENGHIQKMNINQKDQWFFLSQK